jgi:alcohol dehydrogenase
MGAGRVILADARAPVRERAARLGLTAIEPSELRGLAAAPLVIDASADPEGLRTALGLTAPDGVCSSSGALHRSARIPIGLMFARNVTLKVGRTHARSVMPDALELVASRRIEPELVTSHLGNIDGAPQALDEHMRGGAIKTVLVEGG